MRESIESALHDLNGQMQLNFQILRLSDLYRNQKIKMLTQDNENKRIIRQQRDQIS